MPPNDSPFSGSQFKAFKYRPDFPARFGCSEDAEMFCRRFSSGGVHSREVHCSEGILGELPVKESMRHARRDGMKPLDHFRRHLGGHGTASLNHPSPVIAPRHALSRRRATHARQGADRGDPPGEAGPGGAALVLGLGDGARGTPTHPPSPTWMTVWSTLASAWRGWSRRLGKPAPLRLSAPLR